ncbi:MAG: Mechanosensitive ion channel-domain-containing protein [Benjaminiella poitrasii]|nr:MAG: Mechanosensitive ion channel-domain-containing protein [Benjaminiella poitrasii]
MLDENTTTATTKKIPEPDAQVTRPTASNEHPSNVSVVSTTDDEDDDHRIFIDDGIPSEMPLEVLAGPALILPSNDFDGRTLTEEFDWEGKEDDEEDDNNSTHQRQGNNALAKSGVIICLNRNASHIAWFCILLFALIWIAIDVALFVVYRGRTSITSYGLQLWFTWIAFMWCIAFMSQILVELVPWAIKKSVGFLRPQSTEVLRMRLSYYMALRVYIKVFIISAWAWGSWAFIKDQIELPLMSTGERESQPSYVGVFYSIWECCFFASLFLFIEKFILQLIAYEDRIKENDRALRILDKLKKVKRKNPQEFLLKRIRRNKNKTGTPTNGGTNTTTPSRSHSMDEQHYFNYQPRTAIKSIMASSNNTPDEKQNVKFPTQNMDTLIAIPPLEHRRSRQDDEKQQKQQADIDHQETATQEEKSKKRDSSHSFFNKFIPTNNNKRASNSDDKEYTTTTPDGLSRESTYLSRTSQEYGKLIKGGYNKFIASQNGHTNMNHNANSMQQAKYLAKRIYTNLVGPDSQRNTIVEADLYPFFKTTKEASYAFSLFDTDGNGDISKRELRSGCMRIYRERKNLSRSMRDLSQATGKLDIILMVIFIIVWIIIVCAAFGVNVGTDLMPLWSAFVAASFIFGTSAKDAFEAIIFVFVTHPFDAGDRVMIQGENWIVQNVGLLVTTFIKWDGSIVYAKNSVLSTQYIINVRRSGRTGETIELQVSFATPSWKIKQITEHMKQWCNQFPKLYTPNSASTNVVSYQNQNSISLSFYFEHTQNWQDAGGRWLRHNNFMYELKEECERLEISYTLPPQPFVEGGKANDAPPEAYNMGDKVGYGLEGMQQRRPYESEHEDGFRNRPIGGESSAGQSNNNSSSDNPGALAGAASTLMFASSM